MKNKVFGNLSLEQYIQDAMHDLGHTWTVGAVEVQPDAKLIRRNLDAMKASLYDDPDGTQMMLGRLIVLKVAPGKFDIFLMIGEDNDTNI